MRGPCRPGLVSRYRPVAAPRGVGRTSGIARSAVPRGTGATGGVVVLRPCGRGRRPGGGPPVRSEPAGARPGRRRGADPASAVALVRRPQSGRRELPAHRRVRCAAAPARAPGGGAAPPAGRTSRTAWPWARAGGADTEAGGRLPTVRPWPWPWERGAAHARGRPVPVDHRSEPCPRTSGCGGQGSVGRAGGCVRGPPSAVRRRSERGRPGRRAVPPRRSGPVGGQDAIGTAARSWRRMRVNSRGWFMPRTATGCPWRS